MSADEPSYSLRSTVIARPAPAEAMRAPTEAAWAAMSDAKRQRTVDALVEAYALEKQATRESDNDMRTLKYGAMRPTPDELGEAIDAAAQRADVAAQRADFAAQRADAAAQRADAALQCLRDNLSDLIESRGLGALSPKQAAALAQCREPARLGRFFQRALRATSIDSVFAAD